MGAPLRLKCMLHTCMGPFGLLLALTLRVVHRERRNEGELGTVLRTMQGLLSG